ncbi:hypothetical protein GJ496_000300 [Pomphorhynchus laevis]|nr:hypothetical protein GJ496_000300 [Pomphorhynchus laevis]
MPSSISGVKSMHAFDNKSFDSFAYMSSLTVKTYTVVTKCCKAVKHTENWTITSVWKRQFIIWTSILPNKEGQLRMLCNIAGMRHVKKVSSLVYWLKKSQNLYKDNIIICSHY